MKKFIPVILLVLKKNLIRIIAFSFVFMVCFCSLSYVSSRQNASVYLAFKYPEASDGLYPNGTYFNAYIIFTDDILRTGIQSAGLSGRISPMDLAEEISIRPRSSADLITTQYIVTYQAGKKDRLSGVSTEGLLESIIYAYIDHFHNTYTHDQLSFNLDGIDVDNMEYIDLVNHYNSLLNQLQKYLSAQQTDNKDFISNDGTTFQDLINILERYRTTSLKEIRSIVTERGITRSRDSYTSRLKYRIWKLTNDYDFNWKMHQLYKNSLNDYEARLTSVVFIPSLDSEREFYMSKTRIGMDDLAISASSYEESAAEIQRQIKQANEYIQMITDKDNTEMEADNTTRVELLIKELNDKFRATLKKIQIVVKEYSQYKNHFYVTMTPIESSFSEQISLKKAVLITGVLDLVIIIVLTVRYQKKGKGLK